MKHAPADARRRYAVFACLAALVAVGGWLRARGLDFGLPLEMRPDEQIYRDTVARMTAGGTAAPDVFAYGGLAFYAVLGAEWITHVALTAIGKLPAGMGFVEFAADPVWPLLTQRWLSWTASVLTIPAVYALGARIASPRAGLMAAFLLTFSFLPIREAHFGTVDSLLTLSIVVAALALARAAESGTLAAFAWAGAAIGAAAALKYLPMAFLVVAAFAARRRGLTFGGWLFRCAAAAAAAGVVFFALSPFTILHAREALEDLGEMSADLTMGGETRVERAGKFGATYFPMAMGWGLTVAGGVAWAWAVSRGGRATRTVAGTLALYGAVLVGARFVAFPRHVLPAIPLVCVLTASLLTSLAGVLRPAAAMSFLTAALAALAIGPAYRAARLTDFLSVPTTLQLASDFLRERGALTRTGAPEPFVEFAFTTHRIAPWDPPALAVLDEWYVITARHPTLDKLAHADDVSDVLALLGAERVAAFSRFDGGSAPDAIYDPSDAFFFPMDAPLACGAVRGGPDLEIHRIRRNPNVPRPDAPRLSLERGHSEVVNADFVNIDYGGVEEVQSVFLRYASTRKHDRGAWRTPVRYRGALGSFPAGQLPVGTWTIQCCVLTRTGVSAWSKPLTVSNPLP